MSFRSVSQLWPAVAAGLLLPVAAGCLLLPRGAVAAADPAANIAPVPNFEAPCITQGDDVVSGYCAFEPATGGWTFVTPAREAAALAAINAAHAGLGLPPLVLPSDWTALSPDEQQFVLVDLERVAAGLPPIVAETPALDAVALAGAEADSDPQPVGPWTAYATASNWAGDAQPAVAMYGYMYLDGWGGSAADTPNLDCTGPGAPGCWGHRASVLGNYGPTGLLGVGTVAGGPDGNGSSAQFFVAYDGPPVAVGYTWAQALAAGAGGGQAPDPVANPLWPFSDLAAVPWAAGAAGALAVDGIVQGTGPGTFSPLAPVQLQQFVVFLGRALGWPAAATAAPAGTAAYAAGAMGYAAGRGLLPPGLAPAAAPSRLQTVALVEAALQLPAAAQPLPYTDLGGLGPAQLEVLQAAVADGLLQGEGGGRLDPGGGLDRAQAAVLLLRVLLLEARSGRGAAFPLDPTAQVLGDGRVLYALGGLQCLAASAGADPAMYWLPQGGSVLAQAGGQWWTGQASWTPMPAPAWATGSTVFGTATTQFWPAGAQGYGPALFAPGVQVVAFPAGSEELLPGASSWTGAPDGLVSDPARAAADVLVP